MPIEGLNKTEPEEPGQPKWKKIHYDQSDGDEHTAVIEVDQAPGGYSLVLRYLGGSTAATILNIENKVFPTLEQVSNAIEQNLNSHPGRNRHQILLNVAIKALADIQTRIEWESSAGRNETDW